jgi:regulatory factor X
MLHAHINKVFQGSPLHVLESRLYPATLFAHLLRQMLRVNSTAHAAAVALIADHNRDEMWRDWKAAVNAKRIIENELPECGHEEVYKILTEEIQLLLLPGSWSPDGRNYQEADANIRNETVIDRLASFLTKLPSRFPHTPARVIIHCVNALGSAALREITIESGMSFQMWWLTKVFIDEMCHWLAALGGFLDHSPPSFNALSFSPRTLGDSVHAGMMNAGSGSNNDSRYSSMDAEFGPNQSFMNSGNVSVQDSSNSNPNCAGK